MKKVVKFMKHPHLHHAHHGQVVGDGHYHEHSTREAPDYRDSNTSSIHSERVIVLPKRRQRLGSMPSKFIQTDEELQSTSSTVNKYPVNVKGSKSFQSHDSVIWGLKHPVRIMTDTAVTDRMAGKVDSQHENIYRGLLQCLLHPLGTPDNTIGLRPGDLLDHVREVFEVEGDEHEYYISEELHNLPKSLQVNVVVLEANGIKGPDFTEDACDPFCLVMTNNPTKGNNSPRLTPKVSPSSSPLTSPGTMKKGLLPLDNDNMMQRTSTVKGSSHPKWNEEFTLSIEDLIVDELHVFVCDQEPPHDIKLKNGNAIRNFLSVLSHSESDKNADIGYYGKVVVPVRDISAISTDGWYDIVSLGSSKNKQKPVGKLHLRLGISYKKDIREAYFFSSDDYYQTCRQFFKHTFNSPSRHVEDGYGLSLKDHRILKMFSQAHGISKLSQAIVNLICLLEIQCEDTCTDQGEINLHNALDDLQMTWATMQIGQTHLLDKMPLTDTEISNYKQVASKYICQKCEKLGELPELFPPTVANLDKLKSKLGVIVQLLGLDVWERNSTPHKTVSQLVQDKMNKDMIQWIVREVAAITETSREIKDTVLPEIQRLIDLVDIATCHISPLPVVKQFYSTVCINYYRVASFFLEKEISAKTIQIMTAMNKYNKRYNNFAVNIMNASRLTLRLYFVARNFYTAVKDNMSRREIFRLSVFHYQEWFEESMIYWLQTFRCECFQRMEKALEIDRDVVVVASQSKYSHSSVDVLSCFAQVISEWRKIDFRDAVCAVMGVTNITDIICDGARLYADKIHSILERNCYFDDNLNAEFDVNERVCITLNNIEHVRLYLKELPQLLAWDTIIMMVSTKYNSDDVGHQSGATLQRLIETADEEILMKSSLLLKQIAEKMKNDMEKFMEIFTQKAPHKASSVDQFLGYLETNLKTFNIQLMPALYPYMIEQMWNILLLALDHQIPTGKHPDFYEQMKQHLRAIGSFFLRCGLCEKKLHSDHYDDFKKRLDLNSKKTEELILMYFHKMATEMVTPTESYGHLAFKAAYMEETRGNITLFITVLRGCDLPGLDASGYSDPYVVVSLQPAIKFGYAAPKKTHVVNQTLNPVFNVAFQFPNIPKEYLYQDGTCVLLTVFDHDHIGRDDFAGEIVLHLPSIMKISMDKSMDKLPAIIMPLKRPAKPLDGPYTIINQRDWDKDGRHFRSDRSRFIDHQPSRTDKHPTDTPKQGFFSNILSNIMS